MFVPGHFLSSFCIGATSKDIMEQASADTFVVVTPEQQGTKKKRCRKVVRSIGNAGTNFRRGHRAAPNIGTEHKLRVKGGKKGISRLSLYLGRGLQLEGGNDERKARNDKSKLLKEISEVNPTLGQAHFRGHATNEEAQIKLENLILEIFPDSEWADYIKQLEDASSVNISFTSMSIEMYRTIFYILTFPRTEHVMVPSLTDPENHVFVVDSKGNKVFGRGNNYKTMTKIASCVNSMHRAAKIVSPATSSAGQNLLNYMQKSYIPNGAPTVDPVQFLTSMYDAIQHATNRRFKSRKVLQSDLSVTRNWVMFQLMWIMFARPSEIYNFCPAVESILSLPPKDIIWDIDGLPPYLYIDLLQWKNRSISKGRYQIKLVRN